MLKKGPLHIGDQVRACKEGVFFHEPISVGVIFVEVSWTFKEDVKNVRIYKTLPITSRANPPAFLFDRNDVGPSNPADLCMG